MKKLLLLCFLVGIYCENTHVSGVIEDTDTGITIYMDDGKTPASGALVKFIPYNYRQTIGLNKVQDNQNIWEATTDTNGILDIPSMPDSTYNIIIEKDSLKALQEEVPISSEANEVRSDTLEKTGSITAFVALQPNDMDKIQSVFVQVLGTDVEFRNVDKKGKFSLNDLAPGTYRLRFETNLTDYTTTFKDVTVKSDVDTTLPDTIEMIFHGIDVVRNILGRYDTASGVITLQWDSTQYSDMLDYVIFRDDADAITYSDEIHASVLTPVYHDTIYDLSKSAGSRSITDTLSYAYKYRIAIRNNSTKIGNTYGVTSVAAYPPYLVQPAISLTVLDTIISPDDTFHIAVALQSTNRSIAKLQWHIDSAKACIDSLVLNEPAKQVNDTLVTSFSDTGSHKVYIAITDDAGSRWTDSTDLEVKAWIPEADAGNDTNVSISDKVYLKGTCRDNHLNIRYAWKIGAANWIATSTADTFFIAPSSPGFVTCSLKVVDDDNQSAYDAMKVTVTDITPSVDAGADMIVGIGQRVHLTPHISDDGTIDIYEWNFNNTGWLRTHTGDTTIVAPFVEGPYPCKIRVTDNDGRQNSAEIVLNVQYFTEHCIFSDASYAHSVYAIDMDQDGDVDVLSASSFDNTVRWYENDGSQHFTSREISNNNNDVGVVFAIDMDGDGDVDVLSASGNQGNSIRWYENDGTQHFITNYVANNVWAPWSIFATDMDHDGDIDVLSATRENDYIRWYENNGIQQFTIRKMPFQTDHGYSIFAIDMDRDGDIDILSASHYSTEHAIRWYENDGSQQFTSRDVDTQALGANSIYAIDVDHDGDMDILASANNILWYENNGTQSFTRHSISTEVQGPNSIFAIDIDNDGNMDVLSASHDDNAIRWYKNDGAQSFTANNISTNAMGACSIYAIDIDNDGDVDVLSASSDDNSIRWYENHLINQ